MSTGPASRSASLPRFGRGAALGLFLPVPAPRRRLHGAPGPPPPPRAAVRGRADARPRARLRRPGRLPAVLLLPVARRRSACWPARPSSGTPTSSRSTGRGRTSRTSSCPPRSSSSRSPRSAIASPTTRSSSCPSRSPAWPRRSSPGATASRGPARSSPGWSSPARPTGWAPCSAGIPPGLAYPLVPLVLWGVEGALAGSVWERPRGAAARSSASRSWSRTSPTSPRSACRSTRWRASGCPRGDGSSWPSAAGPGWPRPPVALAPRLRSARRARAPELAGPGSRAPRGRRGGGRSSPSRSGSCWRPGSLAAGVVTDPRAAARRSLVACLPWLLAAVAATRPRDGSSRAALAAAAARARACGSSRRWRRWWSPRLPVIPVALAVGRGPGGRRVPAPAAAAPAAPVRVGRRPDAPRGAALLPDARRPLHPGQRGLRPHRVPRGRGARAGGPRRGRARAAAAGRPAPDALDLRAPAGGRRDRVPRPPAGGAPAVRGRVPPGALVELHPPAGQGAGPRRARARRPGRGRRWTPWRAGAGRVLRGRAGARARTPGRGGLPSVAADGGQRLADRRRRVRRTIRRRGPARRSGSRSGPATAPTRGSISTRRRSRASRC